MKVNNRKLNVIFLGAFSYPIGYAATKRKQQFLDYILAEGDDVRVLLTLKLGKNHELNENKGNYKGINYKVIGSYVKKNIFLPFTFLALTVETFIRLYLLKSKTSKNILVTFEIFPDTFLPILFGHLIGYKIVLDIVEDFGALELPKTTLKKIEYFSLLKVQKFVKTKITAGISVITKHLFGLHKAIVNEVIPVYLIPVSADNINLELSQKNKKENDNFTFLYSGTYGAKEGLQYLFEAFSKFREIKNNSILILTGNCPKEIKEQLKNLYKIYDYIKFTGRLDDKEYYTNLAEADILLMTRNNSKWANAGFPYKLGEYLATGNPTICTDVSDISIYLKNMESAIIIESENVQSLLDAMLFLKENPKKAKIIGLKGQEVCRQYFNPEINSKMFYELLQIC